MSAPVAKRTCVSRDRDRERESVLVSDDCMLEIIRWLRSDDKKTVRLVCKHFLQLVDPLLEWRFFDGNDYKGGRRPKPFERLPDTIDDRRLSVPCFSQWHVQRLVLQVRQSLYIDFELPALVDLTVETYDAAVICTQPILTRLKVNVSRPFSLTYQPKLEYLEFTKFCCTGWDPDAPAPRLPSLHTVVQRINEYEQQRQQRIPMPIISTVATKLDEDAMRLTRRSLCTTVTDVIIANGEPYKCTLFSNQEPCAIQRLVLTESSALIPDPIRMMPHLHTLVLDNITCEAFEYYSQAITQLRIHTFVFGDNHSQSLPIETICDMKDLRHLSLYTIRGIPDHDLLSLFERIAPRLHSLFLDSTCQHHTSDLTPLIDVLNTKAVHLHTLGLMCIPRAGLMRLLTECTRPHTLIINTSLAYEHGYSPSDLKWPADITLPPNYTKKCVFIGQRIMNLDTAPEWISRLRSCWSNVRLETERTRTVDEWAYRHGYDPDNKRGDIYN